MYRLVYKWIEHKGNRPHEIAYATSRMHLYICTETNNSRRDLIGSIFFAFFFWGVQWQCVIYLASPTNARVIYFLGWPLTAFYLPSKAANSIFGETYQFVSWICRPCYRSILISVDAGGHLSKFKLDSVMSKMFIYWGFLFDCFDFVKVDFIELICEN